MANIPLPGNRFLVDLNGALDQSALIVQDHQLFWDMHGDFDLVHLHFPEYLTLEIQAAYSNDALSRELIEALECRLEYWHARTRIIVTRHVLAPHAARGSELWEEVYELVYQFADGVVHFAPPSVDDFITRYADTDFRRGPPKQVVIPHHNYASLENTTDRRASRQRLGIDDDAQVILVFGAIRNDEERQLILTSFQQLRARKKRLLVSRWREVLPRVSWIRLKHWLRDLTRLFYRLHPHYHFNYAFVPEDETQYYLHAADVLLIPRLDVLNSGNITLGMTFGKVVVGPDSYDVGYLLKTTGNVVFQSSSDVAPALERALELAATTDLGEQNRRRAMEQWSAQQCARAYHEFYRELLRDTV